MFLVKNTSDVTQVCNIVVDLVGKGETSRAVTRHLALNEGLNCVSKEDLEALKAHPAFGYKFKPIGGCLVVEEMPAKMSEVAIKTWLHDTKQVDLLNWLYEKAASPSLKEEIKAKLPVKQSEEIGVEPMQSRSSRL